VTSVNKKLSWKVYVNSHLKLKYPFRISYCLSGFSLNGMHTRGCETFLLNIFMSVVTNILFSFTALSNILKESLQS